MLGGLHSLPFAYTAAWLLQMAVVALLAWRVSCATPARAGALGLVFGTAWLGAATWWLFISLHTFGGLPAWLAVLSIALLCGGLSLYLGAGLAAFARWRSGSPLRDASLFGAVWLLAELARGVIFTGFRGLPAAMRMSTARSRRWRPGSASTASGSSPPRSRRGP